jgi:hypothetical protein
VKERRQNEAATAAIKFADTPGCVTASAVPGWQAFFTKVNFVLSFSRRRDTLPAWKNVRSVNWVSRPKF